MLFSYATVLAFSAVAVGFILVSLLAGKLVRPSRDDGQKLDTYECGEEPVGSAWFNFNPRFYVIAIVFLVFDVEIALIFPVVTVFRRWAEQGLGLVAFVELVLFVGILFLGLLYVWKKGDLEWVRTVRTALAMRDGTVGAGRRLEVHPSPIRLDFAAADPKADVAPVPAHAPAREDAEAAREVPRG
jgi:NADH-quinone oxidoreductase subunit A